MTPTQCNCQQIQVNNIDTNHGYLLFSDKPFEIPSAFEHHCLRINLTQIETVTDYFAQIVPNHIHAPQLKYLYGKLLRELNGITLHQGNRQKRGLLNVVGSAYKYLFGTLDENDRVEFQKNLEAVAQNSIKLHELNDIIEQVNTETQKVQDHENNRNTLDTITYELLQFTEYVEDLEMGMQLSRLGLFNPKLLNYDKLENINSQNILSIKTSTWIDHTNNFLLIISHIPTNHQLIKTIKIIPYPDQNGYQLDYTDTQSYFEKENKVFNRDNKEINNACIADIVRHKNPVCNFVPVLSKELIKYVEPNIILTWNISKTAVIQNCEKLNKNFQVEGNKIIRVTQCKVEIENIILSENYQTPEIDLTPLYTPLELTKIKTIKHNDIVKLIAENNTIIYVIIIISICILIVLFLCLKYVTKNPFVLLYTKSRKQTKTEQNITEQDDTELQLPKMYPSTSA